MTHDRGSITIRQLRKRTQFSTAHFAGDTVADVEKLHACGCPGYFTDAHYDSVLQQVGAMGFDLLEYIKETED